MTQLVHEGEAAKVDRRPTIVAAAALDFAREPFHTPFGFKGTHFREKWICRVCLTGESGCRVSAEGGLAVLWADERVFLRHSETGANALMLTVLEFALQRARGQPFDTPPELQERILAEVHAYAAKVTELPDLNPTFTLNAMIALDHAAWLLYARENGIASFDRLLPESMRPLLEKRQSAIGGIPLLSYGTKREEILALADAGHFYLKIKIGAPGDDRQMLAADKLRLTEVHRLVGGRETPHTVDGRFRFYLDANGRYRSIDQVKELLDVADRGGFLRQIALFEEPLADPSTGGLDGLPVRFAADESLHRVQDVAARWQAGYRAIALKPEGKSLSTTLQLVREAARFGAICYVADSACTPPMLDWNRNVAARLPALPEIKVGLMELNGAQHYARWDQMMAKYAPRPKPWQRLEGGLFQLDEEFYDRGGGIFEGNETNH